MRKKMLSAILAAAVVVTAVPISRIAVMAEENRGKDEFATEITDEFESETDFIIDEQIANGFYDEEAQEMDQDGFGSSDAIEFMMENAEPTPPAENPGLVIVRAADGTQTSYSTLAEAVAAAPVNIGKDGEVTQILVTGTVEISDTVLIDQNKNISIAAAADGTTIKRAAGFLGDMFKVKDESTSFQFGTGKDGENVLNLTVTGALDQGDATGSIISVEGGYFGMSDGVTLTGNRTSAPGAAICNAGGSIGLAGGTITGNQSEGIVNEAAEITGGAIYSLGEIRVSGTVIVKDNRDDGIDDNSIVLGGDSAYIVAIGELAETANLQVRRSDAAAGKIIVKVGTDDKGTALTTMENILAHVHYLDTTEYTINSQTGMLEKIFSTMMLTADSLSWSNAYEHTVDLTFHTNDAGVGGRYYVTWVEKSDSTPGFETVKSNYKSSGNIASSASVQLTDVAYDTAIKVVVYAEDSKGLEAVAPLVLTLKAKASTPTETPVTTTPTPTTRATINPSVSESKVTGLEEPLAFYPKQMYDFTVIGAGTDNTNPIKGDTKWIPYGWSMEKNNIDGGYQKSWSIGNVNGIEHEETFTMYIFFQKFIYNGSEWDATFIRDSLPTTFKSKEIQLIASPIPTPAVNPTSTPAPTTTTPIPVYTPSVSQSTVKGLEEPLTFTSGKTYQFIVTGVGTQNTNPVNGDWQWRPLYWSLNANPTASQRQTIGRIGNNNGITKSGTYDMYIFFQKYLYDGVRKMWLPSDDIQSMKYQFSVKAVSLIPSSLTLKKGKTSTLKPASSWKNVKYSTSNKKIVTVNKKGKVKGISAGTAKITVKSGSKRAVCTITVPGTTAIKNIKSSINVKKGKSTTLKPKLSYAGSPDTVTYKSSNKKIAIVSKYGKITGKKKGTATITIKSGKITKKCKVKVK